MPGRPTGGGVSAGAQGRVSFGGGSRIEFARHARHLHRKADDPLALRLALGRVGVQKSFARLAAQDEVELPREVARVADAGAKALAHERRHQMSGVAGQEDAAAAHRLGQERAELVDGVASEVRVVRAEPG